MTLRRVNVAGGDSAAGVNGARRGGERPRAEGDDATTPATTGREGYSIPLRNRRGEVVAHAIVDSEDAALVSNSRWTLQGEGYAHRHRGPGDWVLMHRLVMGEPAGLEVDHRDGDHLNNRRSNLRVATHRQNQENRRTHAKNTSGYRGVSWSESRQRWEVYCTVNYRRKFGGRYEDLDEAGAAAAALRELHMTHSDGR